MNTYFVQVSRDGLPGVITYKIRAHTELDARSIAFAMDGGFPDNQTNMEDGDIELVKTWTKVTVKSSTSPRRLTALENRVEELEERVRALEGCSTRPQIIDTGGAVVPQEPRRFDCRPCKPNPISFRRGDSHA